MFLLLMFLPTSCGCPSELVYSNGKEKSMPQAHAMTQEERAVITLKALELRDQGKLQECEQMMKRKPLQPYLAKFAKDHFGSDFLIRFGWNLAEADAEYGPGWLTK
jgi:hypothetical protein